MTTKDHMRLGFLALVRLFQILVQGPAVASIFLLLLATGFEGGNPIRGVVSGIYQWADVAVRDAPKDSLLVEADPATDSFESVVTHRSATGKYKPVPAKEGIVQVTEVLTRAYWILVIISFGALLMLHGPALGFSRHDDMARPRVIPTKDI